MTTRTTPKQNGFTILELLIATVISSIVLLTITSAIIQFSRLYYKGVIATTTQNAARALVDDVGRSIQFNGGDVVAIGAGKGYCIGTSKRYSFALNKQLSDTPVGANQSRHSLISDTMTGCGSVTTPINVQTVTNLSSYSNARELLGENMRITKFSITSYDSLYVINVRVVYGDDDLLCSPTAADCNNNTTSAVVGTAGDLTCKTKSGSQFCATSELTTTIKKRVN